MSSVPPDLLVAPRPAGRRARSRRVATPVPSVVLSVAVMLAGCAPAVPTGPPSIDTTTSPAALASGPETPASPTPRPIPTLAEASPVAPTVAPTGSGLLLLAFDGQTASLSLVRLSGEVIPVPLPDPSVTALAPIAGGRLVAVLRDGRAFVAQRGPDGLASGTAWRALALSGPGEMPAGAFIWSATASPDGTRVAAIARPGDTQSPSALVVIDPASGRREINPLADETEGVPPAWVDEARVAIVQRDRFDRLFLGLLAVSDGRVLDRLQVRPYAFGTSGDGRTSVALTGDRLVVGPTAVGARLAPPAGIRPGVARGRPGVGRVSLSRDRRFLAMVVQPGDAGPGSLAIYEHAGDAWRAGPRLAQPDGLTPGWPTWLP